MTIGAGRTISLADNEVVRFQITGTKDYPGVVWLYCSGVSAFSVEWFCFERLQASGPFRLELHKGQYNPTKLASVDSPTLHTLCLDDIGEWDGTDLWAQGRGVHARESELEGENAETEYFSFVLWPTTSKPAGAAVRCKGSSGLNGG